MKNTGEVLKEIDDVLAEEKRKQQEYSDNLFEASRVQLEAFVYQMDTEKLSRKLIELALKSAELEHETAYFKKKLAEKKLRGYLDGC